ncbi:hypothetical protein [Chitinophaga sp. RAB17]|uniref:hypothetical protein n=1 Tax=Chitinophaga sp. RAB17 TaxID=3233049 RepID=UPI003F8F65F2
MSNPMILQSKGIRTGKYFIPPFELQEGELVVIYLYSGAHFHDLEMQLINILTGAVSDHAVKIYQSLTYVTHFRESWIRKRLYPLTVGKYLKKNTQPHHAFASKIYEHPHINKHTKMYTLSSHHQQLISLYATLSNTNHIIFDLIGQGVEGAMESYKTIKEIVRQGGAAILLDNFNEMKNDCTKYIELEFLK